MSIQEELLNNNFSDIEEEPEEPCLESLIESYYRRREDDHQEYAPWGE